MLLARGTNFQAPISAKDEENLLRIVVLMQRRSVSRLQHHDKDFRRCRLGAIEHEIIDVCGKLIANCLACREDVSHAASYRCQPKAEYAGFHSPSLPQARRPSASAP